ncbi:MAG: GIY-YIG nuclease family protein [Candidatus Diapherotrites archaeon]|nr:GIY-YIG nuclease family protein [Candidatus Diapherotrites archaeon]
MVHFVYALACYKENYGERIFRCYYIGETNDLQRRLQQHYENVRNHITDKYTGRFDWVEKVWHKQVPSREDGKRLERYLKPLSPNEKEDYFETH